MWLSCVCNKICQGRYSVGCCLDIKLLMRGHLTCLRRWKNADRNVHNLQRAETPRVEVIYDTKEPDAREQPTERGNNGATNEINIYVTRARDHIN